MIVFAESLAETQRLGRELGRVAQIGECLALIGDLGAGKTHFVKALAAGIEVPTDVPVTSPTFTLVNIYVGGRFPLVHADLYRLEKEDELIELGLEDWIGGDGFVCVEWANRFGALPLDSLTISIEVTGADSRRLTSSAPGPRGSALLDRWKSALGGAG